MPSRNITSDYLTKDWHREFSNLEPPDDLRLPSEKKFQRSPNILAYKKLTKKQVYDELIDGEWYVTLPEISKSKGSVWKKDMKLVLEQSESGYKEA